MNYNKCDTLTASSDGWKTRGDRKTIRTKLKNSTRGPIHIGKFPRYYIIQQGHSIKNNIYQEPRDIKLRLIVLSIFLKVVKLIIDWDRGKPSLFPQVWIV